MRYQILIRMTGAFLVISGCWFAGGYAANGLKDRHKFFRDGVAVLQYLLKEFMHRKVTMTEALQEASARFENPWKKILNELAEGVAEYSGNTFSELWEEVLKMNLKHDFLTEEEWNAVLRIAFALCGEDTEIQQTLLTRSLEYMKEFEENTAVEYKTKGMLYRRLSVLLAVFLVLILI